MGKEKISSRQAINIIVSFLVGSTAVLGFSSSANQDSWISLVIATFMSVPIVLMYSRIMHIFPEKNLYDITYELLGKIGGTIVSLIYIFFSFHLGALVVRDFTEFIQIVTLDETPQIIIAAFLLITCFFILKNGIEVLGRLSVIFLFIIIIVVALTFIFLTKDMKVDYIKPIFETNIKELFLDSIPILLFPFCDTVVFLGALSPHLRSKDSPYKIFVSSIFISSVILLIALLRNILVLGVPTIKMLYFASYSAVSILNIGDFFSRVEILLATNFLFAGIIKITICLYSATKGVSKVFKIDNYRVMLAPICLFMIPYSGFLYESTMQMMEVLKKTYSFLLLFEVIIPILIYIVVEIKVGKFKKVKIPEEC